MLAGGPSKLPFLTRREGVSVAVQTLMVVLVVASAVVLVGAVVVAGSQETMPQPKEDRAACTPEVINGTEMEMNYFIFLTGKKSKTTY